MTTSLFFRHVNRFRSLPNTSRFSPFLLLGCAFIIINAAYDHAKVYVGICNRSSGLIPTLGVDTQDTRVRSVALMVKIAEPVLKHAAAGTLKDALASHVQHWPEQKRLDVAPLEALGRTLAGIGPWLELADSNGMTGCEIERQSRLRNLTIQALVASTDPASPGYMSFHVSEKSRQPLVNAAFLSLGLLRCPKQCWKRLSIAQQERVLEALLMVRKTDFNFHNNWMFFPAVIDTLLWAFERPHHNIVMPHNLTKSIEVAIISFMEEFYKGDGAYGDGASFRWDYYNSYVIQPMLLQILDVLSSKGHPLATKYLDTAVKRSQRYATVLERLISPEGTFPVLGRSSTYRFGMLHLLADMARRSQLPESLGLGSVREALTAAILRMADFPGNFAPDGFLNIGVVGHQPGLAEEYIRTSSLYLCLTGLVHLGLGPADPFWKEMTRPWTQQRIWLGQQDIHRDAAMD